MTKHESTVKHIPCPVDRVYGRLSDLRHAEALLGGMRDPAVRERMLAQVGQGVKPEHIEKLSAALETMRVTADTLTVDAPMVGEVTLRIVERQEGRLVKCVSEGSPLELTLWVQLLPEGEGGCAMRVTIGEELNFMVRQMLRGKLEAAPERLAETLAMLPY